MVKVTRLERENVSSLMRRFSMSVKESGVLSEVRRKRYYREQPTKRQEKLSALWRNKIGKLKRRMIKMGEIQKGQKIDPERIRKEFQNEK
jgi:ribosomal protein S21